MCSFYFCFYPAHARLQPRIKSEPDNSQFSSARPIASDLWQLSLKWTADQPVPWQLLHACSWLPSANPSPANSYLPFFHLTLSEFTFQGTAVTLVMALIPLLWSFCTSLCVSHSLSICLSKLHEQRRPREERDLPKVTQLVSVRAWLGIWVFWLVDLLKSAPALPQS